jgi:hypothetical protein
MLFSTLFCTYLSLFFIDPSESRRMQLDIWIPKYNLALEYQGELPSLVLTVTKVNIITLTFQRGMAQEELLQ